MNSKRAEKKAVNRGQEPKEKRPVNPSEEGGELEGQEGGKTVISNENDESQEEARDLK
jgi:hypothetical protein